MKRIAPALACTILLAGCQTSQSDVDLSEDSRLGRKIAVEKCFTRHMRDGAEYSRSKWTENDVVAYGATQREDGWTSVDIGVEGRRTHVFFNRKTCQMFCGYDNWIKLRENNQLSRLRVTNLAGECGRVPTAKKPEWPFKEGDQSDIIVDWYSVGDGIKGFLTVDPGEKNGYIEFTHPKTLRLCQGAYTFKSPYRGKWRIGCDTGFGVSRDYAKGEITANPRMKEFVAVGKDADSNNVIFVAKF